MIVVNYLLDHIIKQYKFHTEGSGTGIFGQSRKQEEKKTNGSLPRTKPQILCSRKVFIGPCNYTFEAQ